MFGYTINTIIQRVKISARRLHPAIDIGVSVKYALAVVIALYLVYQRSVPVNNR